MTNNNNLLPAFGFASRVTSILCRAAALVALAASLTGCAWLYDKTGKGTEALYQVQPVIDQEDHTPKTKKDANDNSQTGAATGGSAPAETAAAKDAAAAKNKSRGKTPNGVTKGIDLDNYTLLVCDPSDKPPSVSNPPKCGETSAYAVSVADPTGESRNRLKAALVNRSDLICSESKAQIVGTNDLLNFTLGSTTTLLAGAGALVTGVTAAKILSGTAALTNSLRSQMNEVFYANALKGAIIQKMDTLRTAQLGLINSRSIAGGKPVELIKYSTEDMINDVQDYHNDCSFYAGVNGLAQSKTPTGTQQPDAGKPPNTPSIKAISSADSKISITMDVPADGVSITDYVATAVDSKAKAGDTSLTITGKSNGVIPTIEIDKCTPGDDYSVTVVAENKPATANSPTLTSSPSAARDVKCAAAAATAQFPPPAGLTVSSKAGSLQIVIAPPKAPPTPVSGYTATVSSTTAGDPVIPPAAVAPGKPVSVKCVSGHPYDIGVVAHYKLGDSVALKESKQPCN